MKQDYDCRLSHPWPSLEAGIRSPYPTPPSFPEHVLLSQQPQYAIIATTTENPKTSTKPAFYYPHTRANEEEINFNKREQQKKEMRITRRQAQE
jgi:hypothetical protein